VEDAQAMYDNWASDERVTRFLTWDPHVSPEATRRLLESWSAEYACPSGYNWAIELDGQAIGGISVVRHSENCEYAELGYCLGHAWWNQGIMAEAARAVIGYLFEEVGFHRVCIFHAVKNPASGRVAQKCGLTYEGTHRESFKSRDGEFLDIAEYSILRNEWHK